MGGGRGRLTQRGAAGPRLVLALVLALGALVAVTPAPVRAATTWTVTSGADSGGTCPGVDCTLRQAIAVAVAGDTIIFTPGLTIVTLTSDQLLIPKDLTIQGSGVVTVRRSTTGDTPDFRIFEIAAATVQLQGLTLTSGKAANLGGGLFNNGGTVMLTNSVISGNTTRFGGGISSGNGGTLTLIGSTVSGNTTTTNFGGGIYNGDGPVTLTNSVVSGNTSGSSGGGIYNTAGTVTLTGSTVSGNSARGGGGISNSGTLTLTNSTVSGNTARDFNGGGISNSGNTASVTLIGSTISGNSADGGSIFDGNGGGLANGPGTVTLINSTISGNLAASAGGGVYNSTGTVTLRFVTLVGNSTASQGGGIANVGVSGFPASTILGRSILSGNTSPDGFACQTNSATFAPFTSEGYNVIGDVGGCPSDGPDDLAYGGTLAALLSPTLAANGGLTQTHTLPSGSAAIDRVPTGQCAAAIGVDQRGIVRPQGTACDSGAVELAYVLLTTGITGNGSVGRSPVGSGSGPFSYGPNTGVTLTAQPAIGQTFTGWTVDGAVAGWANPLTLTMNAPHTVVASFAPTKSFGDVPPNRDDAAAIRELASRGTIRGYDASTYGPDDGVQRAQMAALIARATAAGPGTPTNGTLTPPACLVAGTWDCEDWGNSFTDQSGDPNLWRNAGTLQHYGVALGYQPADCAAKGRTFPCYGPSDAVTYAETITFITRAMVAKGYWVNQPGATQPYPGVPDVFAPFVATYHFYTQGAGGLPAPPANWSAGATRGWFARALWQVLNSYWQVDRVP